MLRTHTCGALRRSHIDQSVTLCGWVHRLRNAGTLLWIDLRDKYGYTQLICKRGHTTQEVWQQVQALGREDVIKAEGKVILRESPNPKLPTGEIEIDLKHLGLFSSAELPPFLIEEESDASEPLRLQYRYLDLRRGPLQRSLVFRYQLSRSIREFLHQEQFTEIETPLLIKSTPEGARDFIVPSRLHKSQYYALPQSPQLFKQLLMVGGLDRYYQFARCFRDEDHRSDRQPEFTQLDCECSFVSQEDILSLFEGLLSSVFRELMGRELPRPFPRLSYSEAISRYGTDKPDLRYDLPLFAMKETVGPVDFPLFSQNEAISALVVPGAASSTSRRALDAYRDLVCVPQLGAQGLAYLRVGERCAHDTPLKKHFSQEILQEWVEKVGAKVGDLILLIAAESSKIAAASSALRTELATRYHLYDSAHYQALWVIDFPLFEKDPETKNLRAMHHPFTSPATEDLETLLEKPLEASSKAYDLVLNGVEIGGGSIRIHSADLQEQVLRMLGYSAQEIDHRFGFLLQALRYGAPPHGGIALGLDRLCALLLGEGHSIRDSIAFPKNTSGRDLMIGAPSTL